jgi:hypothetical protein
MGYDDYFTTRAIRKTRTTLKDAVEKMSTVEFHVAMVLMDTTATRNVKFSYGGVDVSPGALASIGGYILRGKIKVTIDATTVMAYFPATNKIRVNTLDFQDCKQRAVLVHEATHAVYDKNGGKMLTMEAEVAGFIAQALYLRTNDPRINKGQKVVIDDTEQAGFTTGAYPLASAAVSVADLVLAGKSITDADVADLKAAIDDIYELSKHSEKKWTKFNKID